MTDATGRGGVDGKGVARGLDVEVTGQALAAEDEPVWTARGEEAGRILEGGKARGSMDGQLNCVLEANVIFLSGVNTSCSRLIDLMSELGEACPSISVSSRLALAADNLLSTDKGTDLNGCFSRLGLFFCGELFLLDKLVELALLLSLLFGRTDALGRGALGGQVRHSSGEERSRSGVWVRRARMAGHVSGMVRMGSPWLTHSNEGTGDGEREEEDVGRVALMLLEDGDGRVF